MYGFDLEKAVSAWRRSLEHNDTLLPDDLDELEAHLRDHVEALVEGGSTEKEAFERALHRLGSPTNLESEYRKVRFGRMKRDRSFRQSVAREGQLLKNYFTTASFFELFSFPLSVGSPATVLAEPNSVVVTRDVAERLFGALDPIGRTITVELYGREVHLTVSGVARNPPRNSTIQFHVIAPISHLPDDYPQEGAWGASMYRTYALLHHASAFGDLTERMNRVVDVADGRDESRTFTATPLADFYLSDLNRTGGFTGKKHYVYIFMTVALLILLIAAVNYVNLATALGARRTREIGVRKTLGASRFELVRQFTTESVILSFAALVTAIAISLIAISTFNDLFGKELTLTPNPAMVALCTGVCAVGILAGAYPAFMLSPLRPMDVLGGGGGLPAGHKGRLRQGLVVFQFAVSLILMIGTAVVQQQLDYVQTKDLGFEDDQVVAIDLPRDGWMLRGQVQQQVAAHPAILSASVANAVPAGFGVRMGYRGFELSPDIEEQDEAFMFAPGVVDYEFVETLGLRVLAGRDFSRDLSSDESLAYLMNEKAVENLGWTTETAVGKPFRLGGDSEPMGRVIGVVEDFHIASLREEIEPVVLQLREDPSWSSSPVLLAKLSPANVEDALDHLKAVTARIAPDETFKYEFLDDQFDAMYREETRIGRIFTSFAALAIFLACLGLYGLSAYAAESRTKEIGIRKVMGASVGDVVALLSRNFLLLVAIGCVFAAPIAYYLMNLWLDDFAFRIGISLVMILMIAALMLLIALAAVIFESLRAATTNPVKSLRYE